MSVRCNYEEWYAMTKRKAGCTQWHIYHRSKGCINNSTNNLSMCIYRMMDFNDAMIRWKYEWKNSEVNLGDVSVERRERRNGIAQTFFKFFSQFLTGNNFTLALRSYRYEAEDGVFLQIRTSYSENWCVKSE